MLWPIFRLTAFPLKTVGDGSVSFHRRYRGISPEQVIFDVELQADNQKIFSEQAILYPLTADSFLQRHEAAGFDKTPFSREQNSGLVMVFTKQ
jgi:hypothetical protein